MLSNGLFVSLVIAIFLLLGSCTKEEADKLGNSDQSSIEESIVGYLNYGDVNQSFNGLLTVTDDAINIESIVGSLHGTVIPFESGFNISITSGSGALNVFINTLNGTYDTASGNMTLSGASINNQSLTLYGYVQTIEEANQEYYDSHSYTGIYFTHSESCNATIYVSGLSLGPVETYWNEGGMCATDWFQIGGFVGLDYDDDISSLVSASGVIEGLDGNPVSYEHNYAALFVLPKNQQYTYYVDWDNGETTQGTFTTPNGGLSDAICIENNGEECDYSEPEETGITINTLAIDPDINYSPYDNFSFDESIFIVKNNRTRIEIGNAYGGNPSIIMTLDYGEFENFAIDFDSEENLSLYVVMGGSAVFNLDFTAYDLIYGTDTKGSLEISNLDYESGTASLYFNNVLVNFDTNFGSQYFRFSGTLSGTFIEE